MVTHLFRKLRSDTSLNPSLLSPSHHHAVIVAELLPQAVTVSEGDEVVELCINVTVPPPGVDIDTPFSVNISTVNISAGIVTRFKLMMLAFGV